MRHYGYTAFAKDQDNLYVANLTGIISFNFRTRQWSNVVDPSIFGGLNVKSMVINDNTLFISTINGIVKYEMEKNLMEIFNYPFMGQINDMYIKVGIFGWEHLKALSLISINDKITKNNYIF